MAAGMAATTAVPAPCAQARLGHAQKRDVRPAHGHRLGDPKDRIQRTLYLAACFVSLTLISIAVAQPVDLEYQKWASKQFNDRKLNPAKNERDKDAIAKGRSLACGMCNLHLRTVLERFQKAQAGELKGGLKEEETLTVLRKVCDKLAPKMARRANLMEVDAVMVCKRLVNENGPDLIDAVSVGDDVDSFCKNEVDVCDIGYREMMYVTEKYAEFEQREEAAKRDGSRLETEL